jgi:hypothetical protein
MEDIWSPQVRRREDAQARRLWDEMEQRVWQDVRIFNGLEAPPADQPSNQSGEGSDSDPLLDDYLSDDDLTDVGELGEADQSAPARSIKALLVRLHAAWT